MLLHTILPIIHAAVPRTVKTVGCEDHEELVQDCIASAAAMLDAAERGGRPLIAKAIAFYVIQRAKCGRRSTSASRTCALSPATALDGNAVMESLEAPVSGEGECFSLHDILAARSEDPAGAAARRVDWSELPLSERERDIVEATTQCGSLKQVARRCRVSSPAITQAKHRLADRIARHWGDGILADISAEPGWRCGIRAKLERQHARAERRAASPV